MKIKVNNTDYEVKNNVKAMLLFEGITEKPFAINNVTDFYTYCYSMVYANNTDNLPAFEEFLTWFDDDETLGEQFTNLIMKNGPDAGKKKKTQKAKK